MGNKLYKLHFTFKDGSKWEYGTHDAALDLDQIHYFLKELTKNDTMQVTQESTGVVKNASEIKSIEIMF